MRSAAVLCITIFALSFYVKVNGRPYNIRPTILFSDASALLFDGDLNMARMLGVPMTKAKMEEALRNETDDATHIKAANEAVDDVNNEEENVDCKTQREQAMKKLQMNANSGNYVPTCTGDNDMLYDPIQCHRPSQFCWCVNPETGTPLQGMSKYNGKPNCSRNDARIDANMNREIKGCIGKKKVKFYQRLFASLISEWIITIGEEANEETISNKDKAARWKFAQLDTNNNNRLERREWKSYREELKQLNKLRKCGRNFMRFCDRDGDRRITLDEWLNCTLNVDTSMSVAKPKLILQRKNPFLDILKPED
ncbi:Sparc-related modular calcium-binding protein 1 [Toxocara canis]|uniref:Sparc-related modular calcium-binding protein 1 n=1 Tax=Toxocara canis TaxID=6265 RepID=A0A0B2VHL0_TOXCA|nr:Sparc-related modular calcium-binding protein 1 [Toxocara canis]